MADSQQDINDTDTAQQDLRMLVDKSDPVRDLLRRIDPDNKLFGENLPEILQQRERSRNRPSLLSPSAPLAPSSVSENVVATQDITLFDPERISPTPSIFTLPDSAGHADPSLEHKSEIADYLKSHGTAFALTDEEKAMIESQKKKNEEITRITKEHLDRQNAVLESMRNLLRPEVPQLQNIPKAPQPQFQNPFNAFSSPLVLLATIGSLFTRRPATALFSVGAAAINGYIKGDKEVMERETENYKLLVEQVIKQNKQETDKYRELWDRYKDRYDQMLTELKTHAASFGDETLLATLKYAGPKETYDLIQKRVDAHIKLEEALAGLRFKEAEAKKADAETRKVEAQIRDIQESGGSNEADLKQMARAWNDGDTTVKTNLGRGNQGRRDLVRLNHFIEADKEERGLTDQDVLDNRIRFRAKAAAATSEARTAATRSANLDLISRNVEKAIPLAEELSDKVGRKNWVPLNRLTLMTEGSLSDPNLRAFRTANLQLAELWARAMNAGGSATHVEMLKLALANLNEAESPAAYKAALHTLRLAIAREREATDEFRREHGLVSPAPADTTKKLATSIIPPKTEEPTPDTPGWGISAAPSKPAPGLAGPPEADTDIIEKYGR